MHTCMYLHVHDSTVRKLLQYTITNLYTIMGVVRGVACGCGSMVPEAISEKLEPILVGMALTGCHLPSS